MYWLGGYDVRIRPPGLPHALNLFSAVEAALLFILTRARSLAARVRPADAHALQGLFEADFLVDFGHAAGVLCGGGSVMVSYRAKRSVE